MAQKYPSNWRHCATCVYWTEKREIDYWGKWISVESTQTPGRCMCRSGSGYRLEKPAFNLCSSYVKWPALD